MFTHPVNRRLGLLAVVLVAFAFAAPSVAGAEGTLPGSFQGSAWGTHANAKAGQLATQLGRSAYVSCGCYGTRGAVVSNAESDVESGETYRSGKLVSTAQAVKQTGMRAFARTTSKVVNVRALGGMLTADSVEAVATVNATSRAIKATTDGSAITGLVVNGHAETVSRGETINLPGFGYVVFHQVAKYGNGSGVRGVRVDMMRIVITRQNDLDIPVGSVINVGHAEAGYTRTETRPKVTSAAWGTEGFSSSHDVDNGLGRRAAAYMGCVGAGSRSASNSVNFTSVPGILKSGTVVNTVSGEVSASASVGSATSRIKNVDLLQGVLTADLIRGVATATADGSGFRTSFAGSRFVNLRVLGRPLGDNVAPNTKIAIPGLGTLTLYATGTSGDANTLSGIVTMVVLKVNALNAVGLPVGTEIHIARAGAVVGR
jgi:hypothetical protein